MANLEEIYGTSDTFIDDINENITTLTRIILNNIVNNNLQLNANFDDLWENSTLKPSVLKLLMKEIEKYSKLQLTYIDKNSVNSKMLPYFISNDKVAYFRVIYYNSGQMRLFYITNKKLDAY